MQGMNDMVGILFKGTLVLSFEGTDLIWASGLVMTVI